jgi:hypothetical protein
MRGLFLDGVSAGLADLEGLGAYIPLGVGGGLTSVGFTEWAAYRDVWMDA